MNSYLFDAAVDLLKEIAIERTALRAECNALSARVDELRELVTRDNPRAKRNYTHWAENESLRAHVAELEAALSEPSEAWLEAFDEAVWYTYTKDTISPTPEGWKAIWREAFKSAALAISKSEGDKP